MNAALSPRWDAEIAWSADSDPAALRAIANARGVCAFENGDGATMLLAVSADVRRFARSRLGVAADATHALPAEVATTVRRILVQYAGSEFEADWAYLHHARTRLPGDYRLLLDRWPCFWLHADPEAPFPRWVKTAHPGRPPTGRRGTYIGPFPDKHAAGRFIDLLEDCFDLCRYHHILVQAPNASACAYKEMGKCPAPCDGTISMDSYRTQVEASAAFVIRGVQASRAEIESEMRQAGEDRNFERASQLKTQLERTDDMTKQAYRHAGDIEDCRFVGVFASPHAGWRRLFIMIGGRNVPWCDVRQDVTVQVCEPLAEAILHASKVTSVSLDGPVVEGLGLVAAHLFLPKSMAEGDFLRIDDAFNALTLRRAIRRSRTGREPADDRSIESPGQ